ncbi:MAG TPA: hypothetical protein ENF53_00675 [Thermoprotei archaeon]|nr:hypothetical protein [Thermoprotei archaeon]
MQAYKLILFMLSLALLVLAVKVNARPNDVIFVYNYTSTLQPLQVPVFETEHFRFYYDTSEVSESYALSVANGLEGAWSVMIDTYGFRAPQSADGLPKIRVEIKDLASGIAGATYVVPVNGQWMVSKIEIDTGLSASYIKSTTAHEFFHCVQAAHNVIDENNWIVEGSAVAAEEFTYSDADDYIYWINKFMAAPDADLTSRSYDAALFWVYVWEFTGGAGKMKAIFSALETGNGLPAVKSAYGGDSGFDNMIAEFCETNFFKERYHDGSKYSGISRITATYTGSLIKWSQSVSSYAADYYVIYPRFSNLKITFDGSDYGSFKVKAYLIGDTVTEEDIPLFAGNKGSLEITQADSYSQIMIMIVNTYETKLNYKLMVGYSKRFTLKPLNNTSIKVNIGSDVKLAFKLTNVGSEGDWIKISAGVSNKNFSFKIYFNGEQVDLPYDIYLNPGEAAIFTVEVDTPFNVSITRLTVTATGSEMSRSIRFIIASTGLLVEALGYKPLVNLGEELNMSIRLVYAHNREPIPEGSVFINGTTYTCDKHGCVNLTLRGRDFETVFLVAYGLSDGEEITYRANTLNLTVSWTKMGLMNVSYGPLTLNLSTPLTIRFRPYYMHNGTPIRHGVILVNDSRIEFSLANDGYAYVQYLPKLIGRFLVVYTLVLDETGCVTLGEGGNVTVLWTGINISGIIDRTFVNVNDTVTLNVEARWAHNGSLIAPCTVEVLWINRTTYTLNNGTLRISLTNNKPEEVQVKVLGVKAPYNITETIRDFSLKVTWTGFHLILESLNKPVYNRGEEARIEYRLVYAHNGSPVGEAYVKLNVLNKTIKVANGRFTLKLKFNDDREIHITPESIEDKYGIRAIVSFSRLAIAWTHMIVSQVVVEPPYPAVNTTVKIRVRIDYAHNSSPVPYAIISFVNSTGKTDENGWVSFSIQEKNYGSHVYEVKPLIGPYNLTDSSPRLIEVVWVSPLMKSLYSGIASIGQQGYNVTLALRKWGEALAAINQKDVGKAEELAKEAYDIAIKSKKAWDKIVKAEKSIEDSRSNGRIVLLPVAEYFLNIAYSEYMKGKYDSAYSNAERAETFAIYSPHWAVVLVIVVITAVIVYVRRRRKKLEPSPPIPPPVSPQLSPLYPPRFQVTRRIPRILLDTLL